MEPASHTALTWRVGGVCIAWSQASDGDQRDPGLRARFLIRVGAPASCLVPRQVHGAVVAGDGDDLTQADGVVTDRAVAVGAYGADCPGLVLVADDALAIAHCGWRGTAAGIVGRAVAAMAARSRRPPATWKAFIGPGISGARYEVDAPVLTARSWPESALRSSGPGRAHLDLATVIVSDLAAHGAGDVVRSGVCTASDPRLHSHRRSGPGIVQLLVAWRLDGPSRSAPSGPAGKAS
jgi:copper oxidase (laccase) domain-containing protein